MLLLVRLLAVGLIVYGLILLIVTLAGTVGA